MGMVMIFLRMRGPGAHDAPREPARIRWGTLQAYTSAVTSVGDTVRCGSSPTPCLPRRSARATSLSWSSRPRFGAGGVAWLSHF